MANLTSVVLVLLLSTQLLASNVIDIAGPLTASSFACLASAGYSCVIVKGNTLENSNSVMHPYVIQTLINVKTGGLPADIYMDLCRGVSSLTQVTDLISSITATNYKTIWVKVQTNNVAGCSWAGYSQADNCAFVTQAINAIIGHNKKSGVYSTYNAWQNLLGTNCHSIGLLNPAPKLWYGDYSSTGVLDQTQTFSDYQPFGGWTWPYIKKVSGPVHVSLCGYTGWHALVNQGWKQ